MHRMILGMLQSLISHNSRGRGRHPHFREEAQGGGSEAGQAAKKQAGFACGSIELVCFLSHSSAISLSHKGLAYT